MVLGLIRGADNKSHRMTVYYLDVWYTTNNLTLNTREPNGVIWILGTLSVMHAALPTSIIKFLDISWMSRNFHSRKVEKCINDNAEL